MRIKFFPGGTIAPRPAGEFEGTKYGDAVEITLRGKRWPVPCAAVVALLEKASEDVEFFAWVKDHTAMNEDVDISA